MFCELVFFDRNDFQRNLSPHQKHQTGFPRTLLAVLSKVALAPIAVPFGLYRIFTLAPQNLPSVRINIV
jgi:hypothetical protein